MKRIVTAAQEGWNGARANLIPGFVIICIAALLVAAYYVFPAVQNGLISLQGVRQSWGIKFSMLSGALGAGAIPGLYLIFMGKARRDQRGFFDLFFTCLIWATSMILIDYFYTFQDWFWGAAVTFKILISKMLLDQFVFTPFLSIQYLAVGFRLRDLNYDFKLLGQALRDDWAIKVIIPMMVSCWLTWIPGTLVVYSLPLALQVPLMVLIQCFFALEIAFVSSKITSPNVS